MSNVWRCPECLKVYESTLRDHVVCACAEPHPFMERLMTHTDWLQLERDKIEFRAEMTLLVRESRWRRKLLESHPKEPRP